MANPFKRPWAVLGRKRNTSTENDPLTATAAESYHVELSIPPEGGGEPVTTRFTLDELREIGTLDELRERAAEKAAQAADLADNPGAAKSRPDPADFKGRPIGNYLAALGVPVDKERQKELQGTTILRFAPRHKRKSP